MSTSLSHIHTHVHARTHARAHSLCVHYHVSVVSLACIHVRKRVRVRRPELLSMLNTALPSVTIRLTLWTPTDKAPGIFYLFFKAKRSIYCLARNPTWAGHGTPTDELLAACRPSARRTIDTRGTVGGRQSKRP